MRGLSIRVHGVRLLNMSNMENFLGMLSEQLGAKISINTTVLNPTYPLKFERFGDGKLEDDAEFQSHVKELSTQGHDVAIEFASDKRFYSSSKIYKVEKMARKAYVEDDPVAAVRKALKISPYCPEAYNVMAQFQANTYEEALGKDTSFRLLCVLISRKCKFFQSVNFYFVVAKIMQGLIRDETIVGLLYIATKVMVCAEVDCNLITPV